MTYTDAMRRWLTRIGFPPPSYTDADVKEAETDNLVVDRERTMSELVQHSASFKEKTEELAATTEQRKDDLNALLGHIHQINISSADARTLIERLMRGDPDRPFI